MDPKGGSQAQEAKPGSVSGRLRVFALLEEANEASRMLTGSRVLGRSSVHLRGLRGTGFRDGLPVKGRCKLGCAAVHARLG